MIIFDKFNKIRRTRGVSPIVATILLIGLTVISGAALYTVGTTFLTTNNSKLALDYTQPTVFKSTTTNYKTAGPNIDSFDVQITNPTFNEIIVDLSRTYLYNATDNVILSNWYVQSNSTQLLLTGKESTTITFVTQSSLNTAKLINGDQVYAKFTIENTDGSQTKTFNTTAFTVTATNFSPNFVFVPSSTSVQNRNTVYFMAKNNEQITTDIQGVIWNYGNPNQSYQKQVKLFLGNQSVFHIDPAYATQIVTIPSSSIIGDQNNTGICSVGEACVNVTFPITKYNLTQQGIKSHTNTYGAILSISGLDLISFELKTTTPLVKITLENSHYNHDQKTQQKHHRENDHEHKNKIAYNTVTFDGNNKELDSITVTFDVWNLDTNARTANIQITGLNTTAFSLTTQTQDPKYASNPQTVSLTNTTSTYHKVQDTTYCQSKQIQNCATVTWQLTRNQLLNDSGSTGINAGIYKITVRDTVTGAQLHVDLIIPQFIDRVHVQSIHVQKETHNKDNGHNKNNGITFTVEILDQNSAPVHDATVFATLKSIKGHSTKLHENTNENGIATFIVNEAKSGTYTLTIANVGMHDHENSQYIIYDAGSNTINPTSISIHI